jgi:hypothetical protein
LAGVEGTFRAVGVRSRLTSPETDVAATFEDGSPAIIGREVDKGRVVHFALMPGLSYWRSSQQKRDRLTVGFSEPLRRWITAPTQLAGVTPPVRVDRPLVETPLLVSDAGAAVTLLNWTGERIDALTVSVTPGFPVQSIESIRHGNLEFASEDGGVRCSVPLEAADILVLRPPGTRRLSSGSTRPALGLCLGRRPMPRDKR